MKIVYRYFVSIFFISVSIFFIFTIKSLGKGVNREISLKELKKFAENLQNFDELEISQKCLENVNRAIYHIPGTPHFTTNTEDVAVFLRQKMKFDIFIVRILFLMFLKMF